MVLCSREVEEEMVTNFGNWGIVWKERWQDLRIYSMWSTKDKKMKECFHWLKQGLMGKMNIFLLLHTCRLGKEQHGLKDNWIVTVFCKWKLLNYFNLSVAYLHFKGILQCLYEGPLFWPWRLPCFRKLMFRFLALQQWRQLGSSLFTALNSVTSGILSCDWLLCVCCVTSA